MKILNLGKNKFLEAIIPLFLVVKPNLILHLADF
ncbi:MAG: hypothetical protein RLZZ628_1293 [Bacteroidota bacterium]|jgi:hypothetical protein